LINETNFKYEATTFHQFEILLFIYRRATQNMSANRSSPTIGKTSRLYAISSHCLAALPAKMSAFNRCMRQNAYHGDLTCIFEDLLPCDCYATKANSRTTRSRISQPASAGKEAVLVNCKLITAWYYQNSEPGFCAV